jgi:hypothetical protein
MDARTQVERPLAQHNACARINQIPAELLSQIFTLCLPDAHGWVGCWNYDDILSIASVCTLWHTIALETPTLWTMIKLEADETTKQTLLKRSKNALLSIGMHRGLSYAGIEEKLLPLLEDLHRIRDLRLILSAGTAEKVLPRLRQGTTNLRSLEISIPQDSQSSGQDTDTVYCLLRGLFTQNVNLIGRIVIKGCGAPFIDQLSALRDLSLCYIPKAYRFSISRMLAILQRLPYLETLLLLHATKTDDSNLPEVSILSESGINLPNLRELLITASTTDVGILLKLTTLPLLCKLTIDCYYDQITEEAALPSLWSTVLAHAAPNACHFESIRLADIIGLGEHNGMTVELSLCPTPTNTFGDAAVSFTCRGPHDVNCFSDDLKAQLIKTVCSIIPPSRLTALHAFTRGLSYANVWRTCFSDVTNKLSLVVGPQSVSGLATALTPSEAALPLGEPENTGLFEESSQRLFFPHLVSLMVSGVNFSSFPEGVSFLCESLRKRATCNAKLDMLIVRNCSVRKEEIQVLRENTVELYWDQISESDGLG